MLMDHNLALLRIIAKLKRAVPLGKITEWEIDFSDAPTDPKQLEDETFHYYGTLTWEDDDNGTHCYDFEIEEHEEGFVGYIRGDYQAKTVIEEYLPFQRGGQVPSDEITPKLEEVTDKADEFIPDFIHDRLNDMRDENKDMEVKIYIDKYSKLVIEMATALEEYAATFLIMTPVLDITADVIRTWVHHTLDNFGGDELPPVDMNAVHAYAEELASYFRID